MKKTLNNAVKWSLNLVFKDKIHISHIGTRMKNPFKIGWSTEDRMKIQSLAETSPMGLWMENLVITNSPKATSSVLIHMHSQVALISWISLKQNKPRELEMSPSKIYEQLFLLGHFIILQRTISSIGIFWLNKGRMVSARGLVSKLIPWK